MRRPTDPNYYMGQLVGEEWRVDITVMPTYEYIKLMSVLNRLQNGL